MFFYKFGCRRRYCFFFSFFTAGGCHFGTKLFDGGIDVEIKAREHYCVCYKPNKATRSAAFATAPSNYAMKNYISCQAAIAQIIRTVRGCVMCARERVEMTHSSATYIAVDDYDNSRTALHKQLCGATFIIPDLPSDFLYSPHSPSFSFSSCLHVFLSFLVLANHTQEGCCC